MMEMRFRTIVRLQPVLVAVLLSFATTPGSAGIFSKNQPVPDWAIEANKTHTPDYAKDASSVVLYEEYIETVDASGRAVERHREAMRILKPQGRKEGCTVSYDVDEKINYFRAWTIAADEKQYMAQDTDFAEVGRYQRPHHALDRENARWNSSSRRCGSDDGLRVGGTAAALPAGDSLGDSAERPRGLQALEVDLPPGRAHSQSVAQLQNRSRRSRLPRITGAGK